MLVGTYKLLDVIDKELKKKYYKYKFKHKQVNIFFFFHLNI